MLYGQRTMQHFADSRHATWTAYISIFTLLVLAMLHGQPTYQHLLLRCLPCCMDTQHFNIYSSGSRHATWNAYHSTFTLHINAMLHVQPTFQHLLFTLTPHSLTCLGRLQLHFCNFLLHQRHLISWIPRLHDRRSQATHHNFINCVTDTAPALPCPGIVNKVFVPSGQTVNHAIYKDVFERLRKWVLRVRRDIADNWVLQHDNAPANTALSIREFLAKKNIPLLPHPPYSPVKSKLKRHPFGTMENIQRIVTDELNTRMDNDFQYCYDQWKKCWNHCVTSQRSYFEGDNL